MSEPVAPVGSDPWRAAGCTLVDPDGSAALLVVAGSHDTSLTTALLGAGWHLLADRPAPLDITPSGVMAGATDVPLIVADRDAARLADAGLLVAPPQPARPGSTAVAVLPRLRGESSPLGGVVYVDRAGTQAARIVVGRERFARAASSLVGGVLAPDLDAAEVVAAHARLGEVPALVVREGTDVDAVLAWWAER